MRQGHGKLSTRSLVPGRNVRAPLALCCSRWCWFVKSGTTIGRTWQPFPSARLICCRNRAIPEPTLLRLCPPDRKSLAETRFYLTTESQVGYQGGRQWSKVDKYRVDGNRRV